MSYAPYRFLVWPEGAGIFPNIRQVQARIGCSLGTDVAPWGCAGTWRGQDEGNAPANEASWPKW